MPFLLSRSDSGCCHAGTAVVAEFPFRIHRPATFSALRPFLLCNRLNQPLELIGSSPFSYFARTNGKERMICELNSNTLQSLIPFGIRKFLIRLGLLQVDIEIHRIDRKSTRLNSSHLVISYAV